MAGQQASWPGNAMQALQPSLSNLLRPQELESVGLTIRPWISCTWVRERSKIAGGGYQGAIVDIRVALGGLDVG